MISRSPSLLPVPARITWPVGPFAWGLAAVAASIGLGGAIAERAYPSNEILLVAIGVVVLLPLIHRAVVRRFDPFEPIVPFALAWGAMFVVYPASRVAQDDLNYYGLFQTVSLGGTFPEMLTQGLLGAAAFLAAYHTRIGGRVTSRLRPAPKRASVEVASLGALAMAALGIGLFAVFLWSTQTPLSSVLAGRNEQILTTFANTSAYLWVAPTLLIPASLVLVGLGQERRDRTLLAIGTLLAALLVVRAVGLGDRMMLLPLFGGLFVFRYLRRRRRPSVRTCVLLLLVALIASTFIGRYRLTDERARQSVSEIGLYVATTPSTWMQTLTGEDAAEAGWLAAALAQIPEQVEHTDGRATLGDLITRGVPRELRPAKPLHPKEPVLRATIPVEYRWQNPEFTALLVFYLDAGPSPIPSSEPSSSSRRSR